MSEELVMWVDLNENLLKPIPISLANSDPKYLHVEIAVLVVDNQRRVLLQKRSRKKKVLPGVWTIAAAGHVTYGATNEETAYRELKEETGITDIKLKYLFRELVTMPNERHFCHWYIGKTHQSNIIIQESEVDDYSWVAEHEYVDFSLDKDISPRTDKMIKRFWSGEWEAIVV